MPMKNFLIHEAVTKQGTFRLKGWRWWFATDNVIIKDGIILWEISYPKGVLVQYPDKTKRFISKTWEL